MSRHKVEGLIIDKSYRVDNYMCSGAFGALYSGTNLKTNQIIAIKLELKDTEEPTLPLEYQFYTLLGKYKGLPEIYFLGLCDIYNTIVMEMLGPTLEKMHKLCQNNFSADTTAKVSQQLISIIEFLHNKRVVYRDIKPENFLLGPDGTPKANTVHLIDFGLAKEYIDSNGKHIPPKSGKPMIGTPRYMSNGCHAGHEQSRRDDMESIGYMLIYFIKGSLPWQGFTGTKLEIFAKITKVKSETSIDVLCKQIPKPFADYMKSVKKLQFESKPNYEELTNYFKPLINYNLNYDWENKRVIDNSSNTQITQTVGQRNDKFVPKKA